MSSSIGGGGRVIFTCTECGTKENTDNWLPKAARRLAKSRLCFDCDYWMERVDLAGDPNSVRIDGRCYWIEAEDKSVTGFRGYGGRQFVIQFDDGRIVETSNLWSNGSIPEQFRDRLPDNAKFVNQKKKAGMFPI